MNRNREISLIIELISESEIEEAFERLDCYVKKNELERKSDDLVQLKAQYSFWKKNNIKGVLTHENRKIDINQISKNLIDFTRQLERSTPTLPRSRYITNVVILFFVLFIVLFIVLFYVYSSMTFNKDTGNANGLYETNTNQILSSAIKCYYNGSLFCSPQFNKASSFIEKSNNPDKDIYLNFFKIINEYQSCKNGSQQINESAFRKRCNVWVSQLNNINGKFPFIDCFIAELEYEQGNYQDSKKTLEKIETKYFEDRKVISHVLYKKALTLSKLDKSESTQSNYIDPIAVLNKASSLQDSTFFAKKTAGIIYMETQEDINFSAENFDAAIDIANNNIDKSEIFFLKGILYLKNKNKVKAKKEFKQALNLNKKHKKATIQDAILDENWEEKFKEAIRLFPKSAKIQYEFARKYHQSDDRSDFVCFHLKKASSLDPDSYENYYSNLCEKTSPF